MNAAWDGAPEGTWIPDVLGPGFEARRLPVAGRGAHDAATLVRCAPGPGPDRDGGGDLSGDGESAHGTVIYVHGWSDYFANPELARTVTAAGCSRTEVMRSP